MQRLSSIIPKKEFYNLFGETELDEVIQSYAVDQHQSITIILDTTGKVQPGTWGLNPNTSRQEIYLPYVEYNRAHVKPTFRMAFRENKGIAVIDSFYAWQHKEKIPHRICLASGDMMFVPMVYFKLPEDQISVTLLVRRAQKNIEKYTEVEPLIFSKDEITTWLANPPVEEAIQLLRLNRPVPFSLHRTSNKAMVSGFDDKILHQTSNEEPSLFG